MTNLIIFKELREIILSTKFAATFGVCSILIILAFYTGIKNYQRNVEEYNASKAAQLREYESLTDWYSIINQQIFLAPEPLASLVMGVSNDLGRMINVGGETIPVATDSTYSENPVFAVFRFMDLEFVFQIILSLFAILFAYDAINGEKEKGTLRLSFANSLPRANYILGKLIGSFLALALPLLIPVLLGTLLLPLMNINLSTDEWLRLELFIICGLLYLGVFLTLSVFVSCLTQRSSNAFLFLLVIWVFSVLIIPRSSVLIASNMVEVLSQEEIIFQRNQLSRQNSIEMVAKLVKYSKESMEKQIKGGDFSLEANEKRQKDINEFLNKISVEDNKKVESLTGRLNEERRNKQIQQERLAFGIARISPAATFNLAATTLCGTSMELKNYFQKQAAAYSESFSKFISEKIRQNPSGGVVIISGSADEKAQEKPKPINAGEIPEFSYKTPDLNGIINNTIPDIAILILFNLIFLSGAFLSFLRYDLR